MKAPRLLAAALATLTLAACADQDAPIPSPPRLQLSATQVTFTTGPGDALPGPATVVATNGGSGALAAPVAEVTYQSGAGWLTVGVTGAAPPYLVILTPASAALPVGTYAATVALTSAGATGSPQIIAVTLTVPPPALAASPSSLSFSAAQGAADPAPGMVTVTNGGAGSLAAPTAEVTFQSGAGWLTASVSGAAPPYTVTATPTLAGLAVGSYAATVTLTSAGASNSPLSLPVTLQVTGAAPAGFLLSADSVAFATATPGSDPAPQQVTVAQAGAGALPAPTTAITYGPGQLPDWLTATVSGTAPPYTITLEAATGGLFTGLFQASVVVQVDGSPSSPQTLAVDLVVGRLVTVSRMITHWEGDAFGTTSEAADARVAGLDVLQDDGFSPTVVTPMVPEATAGRWRAAVEPGPYQVVVSFLDGSTTTVPATVDLLDLGFDLGGRTDAAQATQVTDATLTVTGLDTWRNFDTLRFFAWGAQLSAPLVPTADWIGFTDPDPYTFDWAATMGALLAPADELWVAQYHFGAGEGLSFIDYLEAAAATSMTGVQIVDGQPFELAPPLASLVLDRSALFPLDWRQTEFEAAGADFAPAPLSEPHRVGVYAIPAPLEMPSPLGAAAVPLLQATYPAIGFDVDGGQLSFGRFLPGEYQEYFEAAYELPAPVAFSAAAAPLPGAVNHVLRRDALALAPNPVSPALGALAFPTIDGLDALVPQAVQTATPLLAWLAPSVGVPTSLWVELWGLTSADGLTTQGVLVASYLLAADASSLQVPAGVLTPGATYAARLVARQSPADATGDRPFRTGVPSAEGALWTAAFTVAP